LLFADLYILYLFKVAVHWLKFYGNRNWPAVNGSVTAAALISGHTVEVPYEYRVDGELYTGLHEEPFLLADSMASYATKFRTGDNLVVRTKPAPREYLLWSTRIKLVPPQRFWLHPKLTGELLS